MPDETKRVRATIGPFAGGEIDIPADMAEAAISDGWAVDPYAPVDPKAEAPAFDQEKYDAAVAAADKAARKLRGQDEPAEPKAATTTKAKKDDDEADDAAPATTKTYVSDSPATGSVGYQTRKPAGRPRKG